MAIQVTGWIANILIILCCIPQVAKSIKTKNVAGLSFTSYFIFWFGCLILSLYAAFLPDRKAAWPVWTGNAVSAMLVSLLFFLLGPTPSMSVKARTTIAFAMLGIMFAVIFIALLGLIIPSFSNRFTTENMKGVKYAFAIIGGLGVGAAFLPQVMRTFIKRETVAISLLLNIIMGIAEIVFIVFWGLLLGSDLSNGLPGVIFSIIALINAAVIVTLKLINVKKGTDSLLPSSHSVAPAGEESLPPA